MQTNKKNLKTGATSATSATGATGFTTGTCAAAAAKAAAIMLCYGKKSKEVYINLPDNTLEKISIAYVNAYKDTSGSGVVEGPMRAYKNAKIAEAAVKKDAGDDPDVTHGALIIVRVEYAQNTTGIGGSTFEAGIGIGKVTKPGLSLPVNEPAINRVPRQMILDAIGEITEKNLKITISIPNGEELAKKTFNSRLGIKGGLSILGTSGRVRPFSLSAIYESLKCSFDIAFASGITSPVLVPGRIGRNAANNHFSLKEEQVIEIGNLWGKMLSYAVENYQNKIKKILILGHPGKLVKLAMDQWDTHSSRSMSATKYVKKLAETLFGDKVKIPESETTQGLFHFFGKNEQKKLAAALAGKICEIVYEKINNDKYDNIDVSVVLINIHGELLGYHGNISEWQKKSCIGN